MDLCASLYILQLLNGRQSSVRGRWLRTFFQELDNPTQGIGSTSVVLKSHDLDKNPLFEFYL
jgi:hypothetical protein